MNLKEAFRKVMKPMSEIISEEEDRQTSSSEKINIHLRKLEQAAIRHVTESTDEVAEFSRK